MQSFLFKLDDRLKVWMAFTAGTAAIFCVNWYMQGVVLLVSLLLCWLSGAKRFVGVFAVVCLIMAVVFAAISFFTSSENPLPGPGVFFIIFKFGPLFAMMAFVYTCLNTGCFLRSLEKMKVPPRLVIPFGVSLRFIPSVIEECRQVRYAMRMRGISLSSKRIVSHPFETLEYLMVPLLLRTLAIGDELARSAVARGIEAPGPKSSYHEIHFGRCDIIWLTLWMTFLGGLVYMDNQLYLGQQGVL